MKSLFVFAFVCFGLNASASESVTIHVAQELQCTIKGVFQIEYKIDEDVSVPMVGEDGSTTLISDTANAPVKHEVQVHAIPNGYLIDVITSAKGDLELLVNGQTRIGVQNIHSFGPITASQGSQMGENSCKLVTALSSVK